MARTRTFFMASELLIFVLIFSGCTRRPAETEELEVGSPAPAFKLPDMSGQEITLSQFKGKVVTYCSVCDGPVFSGQKVAVIGGGNAALEAIDDMVKIAEHVYVVSVTPYTGDQVLVERVRAAGNVTEFMEHEVLSISGGTLVDGIEIRDLKTRKKKMLAVGGIFVEIGLIPNSELVKGFTILNEQGEVVVNCRNETDVPGLFAAGDVTNVPEKQIVISACEGAKAALQAHKYLQRL